MTALHARTLLSAPEAGETVVREVLEYLGVAGATGMPVARAEQALRSGWARFCGQDEPGEAELMANVRVLAGVLGLDEVEIDVLGLFAALPSQPALQQVLQRIDVRSRHQIGRVLAVVLGHPVEAIRKALASDSPLAKFQVIRVLEGGAFDFSQFALVNDDLERALTSSRADVDEILGAFFVKAPAPTLELADFGHLEPRISTTLAYLRGAEQQGAAGVNVLLYGLPGTGKTELARLIATELGWQGYEVRISNRDGAPSSGDERIGSYLLAQRFLHNVEHRLVVFDEVEDLFSTEYGFSRARLGKLYMNRLLESNAVPSVWIANDVSALSLAVRRRFDLSIPFGPLPGTARAKVLARHLSQEQVAGAIAAQLLRRETLLPSQVFMAKKVAGLAGGGDSVIVETIDASMRLLEQPLPRDAPELAFDVAIANADADLNAVIAGLMAASRRTVVALYGPAGVGKSALAGHLAGRLGRSAVRIGASDVLSTFLGETEQRIARLFEAVDARSEVIIFEEADEVLASRTHQRQSWEVRLANEMMMRMDAFDGMVVLTTNWLERMDIAALRRCELKIKLDYMRPEQRRIMWQRKQGAPPLDAIAKRLDALDQLTAGDFVAVASQAAIIGAAWRAEDWIAALEKEVSLRPRNARAVGFVV